MERSRTGRDIGVGRQMGSLRPQTNSAVSDFADYR
jgi:hypothetical protein